MWRHAFVISKQNQTCLLSDPSGYCSALNTADTFELKMADSFSFSLKQTARVTQLNSPQGPERCMSAVAADGAHRCLAGVWATGICEQVLLHIL